MIGWLRLVRGERPQPKHLVRADRAGLDPLTSHFAPGVDDPASRDGATRRPAGTTRTASIARGTRSTRSTRAKRTIRIARRTAITLAAAALPVFALTAPAASGAV